MSWAYSILNYRQLQGAIGVAVRMQRGRATTFRTLQAALHQCRDPAARPEAAVPVSESVWAFMRGIRGTAAYWADAKSDLHAMLRQIGPPTFFITLSAADAQWYDLALSLAPLHVDVHDAEQRDAYLHGLDEGARRTMLRDRPVDVARHFSNRWSLMLRWLQQPDSPLGGIADVWWRIEFQRRGSAHVHFFVWCEDAPDTSAPDRGTTIPAFIDRHVSTRVPPEGDPLRDLVLSVQQHRHTHTCGSGSRGPRQGCRFGFPRPLSPSTRLGAPPGGR